MHEHAGAKLPFEFFMLAKVKIDNLKVHPLERIVTSRQKRISKNIYRTEASLSLSLVKSAIRVCAAAER